MLGIAISSQTTAWQKLIATVGAITLVMASYPLWQRYESTSVMPAPKVSLTLFTTPRAQVIRTERLEKAPLSAPGGYVSIEEFQRLAAEQLFSVFVPEACYKLDDPAMRIDCTGHLVEYIAQVNGVYLRANSLIEWARIDGWGDKFTFDGKQFISTPIERSRGWALLAVLALSVGALIICFVWFESERPNST